MFHSFFPIKLRTMTDLYGGHSANVRKSSSELTTRAPVLLFCEIKYTKTKMLTVVKMIRLQGIY